MKQRNSIMVALTVLALTLSATAASAADRLQWNGKDGDGYRYSLSNTAGDSWTMTITGGGKRASTTYTEVTSTEDFVELRAPADKDERTRLYKDKVMFWSKSSGRWIEVATGKWGY